MGPGSHELELLAPPFSHLFYEGHPAAGPLLPLFTIPAGKRGVVKDINLRTDGNTSTSVDFVTAPGGVILYANYSMGPYTIARWQGMQVLEENMGLDLLVDGGVVHTRVSGFLLSAT